jgi:hypothetical protein
MNLKKIEFLDPQLIINWSDNKREYMMNYKTQPTFRKIGKYYILWI